MGNTIVGGRKKAKVMKIDGQTLKFKTPVSVRDVIKDYPNHVLLDSSTVKQFGIRAKPLEPQLELKPKKIYFLVELPKLPDPESSQKAPRRARSVVHLGAKDRLEYLKLSRRSSSDITVARPPTNLGAEAPSSGSNYVKLRDLDINGPLMNLGSEGPSSGPRQVKLRLPRAQVAKLVEESKDGVGAANKIIDLYMESVSGKRPMPEGSPGFLFDRQCGQGRTVLGSIRESVK